MAYAKGATAKAHGDAATISPKARYTEPRIATEKDATGDSLANH